MDEPVSLESMLAARERRAALRREFFRGREEKTCLLQISVNIPGPEKNSPMIRDIFDASVAAVRQEFPRGKILPFSSRRLNTGPEAWLAIPVPAYDVKEKTGVLEENHPWGRLWDIDVFIDPDHSISRREAGLGERSCFLCNRPAHECARSRAHDKDELKAFIGELYEKNRILLTSL